MKDIFEDDMPKKSFQISTQDERASLYTTMKATPHQEKKSRLKEVSTIQPIAMKSRLTELEAGGTINTSSLGHHDDHCAIKHRSNDKYRVERNIPTENSINENITAPGCESHYTVRYVKLKEEGPEKKQVLQKEKAAFAMIWGEILNDPIFKRHRR